MEVISRIGLDIAKRWFQVHAVSADGTTVLNRKLAREAVLAFFTGVAPCDVALEASGSAHYWAREIGKSGHRVRLIPPIYVKPYVKRGKNDAHDARAICEAASRPDMRFVPIKSEEQQAALMQHTTRQLMVERRTALVNSLRGQLAEFGVVANKGIRNAKELITLVDDGADGQPSCLPAAALNVLKLIVRQLQETETAIVALDEQIHVWHEKSPQAQVLTSIPGIGPLIGAAIAATAPDHSVFRSGRDFAAWIGLVPRQHSSGGKERLGRISKQGNPYLRKLLVLAATSHLRWLHKRNGPLTDWLRDLLKRRPARLVTIALANKLARICWALMNTGELYRGGSAATVATV
jgi:transposase